MASLIATWFAQGRKSFGVPTERSQLPNWFRGRPVLQPQLCPEDCLACVTSCPTNAISKDPLRLDMGRCLYCHHCFKACQTGALTISNDHRLATSTREDLILDGHAQKLASALDKETRRVLGRALRLRQVSAGGCNGCESELQTATNVVWDMSRFGIHFVASPRHADGIVVTGPVSANMEQALRDTLDAVPSPRIVVAAGTCAISGGVFADLPNCRNGVMPDIPVDLYIPGCPPHPLTFLDGLLRLLGRMK
ncbi:MAG TPA: hydrogenase [Myxococcota bacterium]|nr:hydrogenase [Myxococcota bacterium]HOS62944.1 hydrogenase [Myxococcota bacterium]HPC91289.1 hydrogenase [Myxococcota bacterium]HPL26120.1 hydrogenase [Myxococcota bacterium]HQE74541.1 hydrogenase [Myxococcota bacterium]